MPTILREMLSLVARSIGRMLVAEAWIFTFCAIGAAILAAGCWYACIASSKLWNRGFRPCLAQHLVCALAALLTFAFALVFTSAGQMKRISFEVVGTWERLLRSDTTWASDIYASAYRKVRELGLEDFSGIAPPGDAASRIPTLHDASRRLVATLYVEEACRYFDERYPFLSGIALASSLLPVETVLEDVRKVQREQADYPLERAVRLVAEQIREGLLQRIAHVVFMTRVWMSCGFLLAQSLAFGFVAWSALRELRRKDGRHARESL